jgi:hypothetical protein
MRGKSNGAKPKVMPGIKRLYPLLVAEYPSAVADKAIALGGVAVIFSQLESREGYRRLLF